MRIADSRFESRKAMANDLRFDHWRLVRILSIGAGVLLAVIGVRFLLVPDQAARTFGLAKVIAGSELQFIIGLRDLWLGGLAIAFAALKEWRALSLWFGLGTVVCFSDAGIAATSSGRTGPVVFHLVCGVACALLAASSWRLARASGEGSIQ